MMRNAMDHLHGNLGNISKRKGSIIPIFGILTFCTPIYSTENSEHTSSKNPAGAKVRWLIAGSLTHDQHHFPLPNMAEDGLMDPIGPFIFSAFDKELNLSRLIMDVQNLVEYFETDVRAAIEKSARIEAQRINVDVSELLTPQTVIPRMETTLMFTPPGQNPSAPSANEG